MVSSENPQSGKRSYVGEWILSLIYIYTCFLNANHPWRAGASTVLTALYDSPSIASTDDPALAKVNGFVEQAIQYAIPGKYLVEIFTWMKYLPSWMAKWKRDAEKGYQDNCDMFIGMFRDVEERIVLSFHPFWCAPVMTMSCRNKETNGRVLLAL